MNTEKPSLKRLLINSLATAAILMIFVVAVARIVYFVATPTEEEILMGYNSVRPITCAATASSLFYIFFLRIVTKYSSLQRNLFFSEPKPSFFKQIFNSTGLLCDIILFSLVYFIFDLDNTFPFIKEALIGEGSVFESKPEAFILVLPTVVLLDIIARGLAYIAWKKSLQNPRDSKNPKGAKGRPTLSVNPNKLIPTPPRLATARYFSYNYSGENPALSIEDIEEADYSSKARTNAFSMLFAVFAVCIILCNMVYSVVTTVFLPFIALLTAPAVLYTVLGIIIAIPLITRLKALFSRIRFIKTLRRLCRERKYKLSKIVSPYLSLFTSKQNESFCITLNGKTFSCKLISGKKQSLPLILNADGIGTRIHAFVFGGIKWFQFNKSFEFGYESKNPKILIINPISKFIYSISDGSTAELDNGSKLGDYTVYTAQSFLNSIERDVLGV